MKAKKLFALSTCYLIVINSAIASSLPGGAVFYTADYFHVTDSQQYALPISVYMIGYIFGPLFFSPLSEMYGRRIIMITSFVGYTAFTLGCAMAPTWPSLLIFRFLVGLFAAAPYALGGGICADLYSNAAHRGMSIMVLMIVSLLLFRLRDCRKPFGKNINVIVEVLGVYAARHDRSLTD